MNFIFGGTTPKYIHIEEDYSNDLEEAKVVQFEYLINNNKTDTSAHGFEVYEQELMKLANDFSSTSDILVVHPKNGYMWDKAYEFKLPTNEKICSFILVFVYSVIAISNFHPVRCRILMVMVAFVSVFCSYYASVGFSIWFGFFNTDVH